MKKILKMLEIKNSKIIARKEFALTKELLKEHYIHIADMWTTYFDEKADN